MKETLQHTKLPTSSKVDSLNSYKVFIEVLVFRGGSYRKVDNLRNLAVILFFLVSVILFLFAFEVN